MTEDLVSYDLAKALQTAGFDWPCDRCYARTSDGENELIYMTVSSDYNKSREGEPPFFQPICSAPTLWQAQKWLREKGIDICVWRSFSVNHGYHYQIVKDNDWENEIVQPVCAERSYGQSLSDAISAALELITKGE